MKEKVNNINELAILVKTFMGNDCAMFWLVDNILIQTVADSLPDFDSIVELRVFNDEKEIFAKRIGSELRYRIKNDTGLVVGKDYFESEAVVRGEIAMKVLKVFSKLVSQRVVIAIQKRDYIGYNEIGAAGYVDSRFVSFTKKN